MPKRKRRNRTSQGVLQALTPQSQPTIPDGNWPYPPNHNPQGGPPGQQGGPPSVPPTPGPRPQQQRQQQSSPVHPPPLSGGSQFPRSIMPEVLDAWQGVSEGWEQGVQDSYRGPERTIRDLGADIQRGATRGRQQQRQGSVRVQPAPGVNPRFEGTPDNFAEYEGRDFRFNPMMDELDDEVPANIRLNRGGVWYWHPYN